MKAILARIALCFSVALLIGGAASTARAAQSSSKSSSSSSPATKAASTAAKVDVNTATEKDLDALPGVGAATAKKIIAGRPYSSVDGLSKAGISAATIKKITPLVTVGGSTAAAASAPAQPAAASKPKSTKASSSSSAAATSASQPAPAAPAAQPAPTPAKASASSAPSASSASAGTPGPGQVWVNLDSGVYHYQNTRYYGKTKSGKYMSEADAMKAGYHAAKDEKKPQ